MESVFIKPDEILNQIKIKEGSYIADFGAGNGYFTTSSAQKTGPDGKVYAIDVQKIVLEALKSRAKMMNLFNIEAIWGNLELSNGSGLSGNSVDYVFAVNVFFQIEKKDVFLSEALRVLKADGLLILIDWKPELAGNGFGPLANQRISKEKAKELAIAAGFSFEREISAGQYHYGLLFRK